MSVKLLIQDGNPYWYLSTDIWVVPGSDPNGARGTPVAGQPAYLWALVTNNGFDEAKGVRVDFYWANPALQVLRSTATLVGSAFADIAAGGSQEVLCLVRWIPVIVNGGHECLVAVANHPGDPLPNPLPNEFDPPTYPQVAQKNLTVIAATMLTSLHAITIAGWRRTEKAVVVTAEVGGELDEAALAGLGLKNLRPAKDKHVDVGLDLQSRCMGDKEPLGSNQLELRVPPGTSMAVYASIRSKALGKDEYQLVHIIERSSDRILGGIGFVVVAAPEENHS